jgi:hypothetical protein
VASRSGCILCLLFPTAPTPGQGPPRLLRNGHRKILRQKCSGRCLKLLPESRIVELYLHALMWRSASYIDFTRCRPFTSLSTFCFIFRSVPACVYFRLVISSRYPLLTAPTPRTPPQIDRPNSLHRHRSPSHSFSETCPAAAVQREATPWHHLVATPRGAVRSGNSMALCHALYSSAFSEPEHSPRSPSCAQPPRVVLQQRDNFWRAHPSPVAANTKLRISQACHSLSRQRGRPMLKGPQCLKIISVEGKKKWLWVPDGGLIPRKTGRVTVGRKTNLNLNAVPGV